MRKSETQRIGAALLLKAYTEERSTNIVHRNGFIDYLTKSPHIIVGNERPTTEWYMAIAECRKSTTRYDLINKQLATMLYPLFKNKMMKRRNGKTYEVLRGHHGWQTLPSYTTTSVCSRALTRLSPNATEMINLVEDEAVLDHRRHETVFAFPAPFNRTKREHRYPTFIFPDKIVYFLVPICTSEAIKDQLLTVTTDVSACNQLYQTVKAIMNQIHRATHPDRGGSHDEATVVSQATPFVKTDVLEKLKSHEERVRAGAIAVLKQYLAAYHFIVTELDVATSPQTICAHDSYFINYIS